ncbi:hypothetical protein KI688_002836 [Linnemannia hyalina]|uniref:Uncharacterized protein n=1 Tax=Linnemannia hyalina TaxID=64524 RepID=A0A9P7XQ29_9FUNG|nr:hypothetical protein KI688_002836 [Linnemannia hyalina]
MPDLERPFFPMLHFNTIAPQTDVIGCPSIKSETPIEFFTKPTKSDAELKEAIRGFPKNVHMDQYKAPKVPYVVSNNLTFNKKHDSQIREFQERCAELTRPVDYFYHQFRQLQEIDPEHLKCNRRRLGQRSIKRGRELKQ